MSLAVSDWLLPNRRQGSARRRWRTWLFDSLARFVPPQAIPWL